MPDLLCAHMKRLPCTRLQDPDVVCAYTDDTFLPCPYSKNNGLKPWMCGAYAKPQTEAEQDG